MQIAARIGAWSGDVLPYDAEVEWLENDGSSGFVTDLSLEESDELVFSASLQDRTNSSIIVLSQNYYNNGFTVYLNYYNNHLFVAGLTYRDLSTAGKQFKLKIVSGKVSLIIDDVVLTTGPFSYSPYLDRSTITISCVMNTGNKFFTPAATGARFYGLTIVGKANLIPVRIGTEGCLFNTYGTGGMNADGTSRDDGLYFSRGTGTFILGPDKQLLSRETPGV